MRESIKSVKNEIKFLPKTPGVYLFFSDDGPIYIGKAKNLQSRLGSYFGHELLLKTKQMVKEAKRVDFVRVGSEFEALLLEATLVRKYMPKYNSALKDDKTPLYIGITKEKYPRIILLRQTQLVEYKPRVARGFALKKVFGPYIDGKSARMVLRKLRKIFPFSTHKLGKRACVNSQIGLCNPCPNWIETISNFEEQGKQRNLYLKNILIIQKILMGKSKHVKNDMKKEIGELSQNESYEEAEFKLNQLRGLEYVTAKPFDTAVYLKDPNILVDIRGSELDELKKIIGKYTFLDKLNRIECYDVAHLGGTYPTASMVTFVDGEPDKNYYRHFKLRRTKKSDDYGGMREVLTRRKKHFESWGKPDLIIVDGGKGQLGVALEIIGGEIPVVGLAKRYETLIFKTKNGQPAGKAGFQSVRLLDGSAKRLVQRLRDESHRFARRYHHLLVAKALRESGQVK